MTSEHAITVYVLDQNDSPSSPRSVHVMVHTFNGQTPLGKIADVHPNDPDTSGDYTCRIIQSSAGAALSIPAACDLHAGKITPGSFLPSFVRSFFRAYIYAHTHTYKHAGTQI